MFLRSIQRNEESVRLFRKALSLQPQDVRYVNALAHVLSESGAANDAVAVIEEALEKGARSADLHNTLGVIYDSISNNEKAASEFRRAIELDNATGLYHYNLALSLRTLGWALRG